MKDQAFFDLNLVDYATKGKPSLLAKLFGKKWISIATGIMVWGIYYKEHIYVLGYQASPSPCFQLPRGYKLKHVIVDSEGGPLP